jgi:hypothetical protein
MAGGRPTKYTQELADEICARIADGQSLREICRDDDLPVMSTIMLWAAKDRRALAENKESDYKGFSEQYESACEARLLMHAEELLDIADDGTNDWMERTDREGQNIGWQVNGEAMQRSRLRVDTRKWLLSKLLPKYADKQAHEHSGVNGEPIKTESTIEWVIQPVRPIGEDEADS